MKCVFFSIFKRKIIAAIIDEWDNSNCEIVWKVTDTDVLLWDTTEVNSIFFNKFVWTINGSFDKIQKCNNYASIISIIFIN